MGDTRDPIVRIVNTLHRNLLVLSKGQLGGRLAGMETVVLTTIGRRTGESRQSVLSSPIAAEDRVVLVGSWGGGPKDPQWVLNLRANPNVQLMIRGETRHMVAREASPEERQELWPQATAAYRGYAAYQQKTDREFPLIILEPLPD